jgi:AraC-like DNA-binding protein
MLRRPRSVTRFRHALAVDRGALLAAGRFSDKSYRDHPEPAELRLMEDYGVAYLLDGGGSYLDELNGDLPVKQGDAIVIFPDLAHRYRRGRGLRWAESWLVFNGNVFRQLERDSLISRDRPILSPGLRPDLIREFDALVDEFSGDRRAGDAVLAARVHLLLTHLVEADAAARQHPQTVERMAIATSMLEEHLDRPLDLSEIAAAIGLGYENFRKLFTRELGIPPARYRTVRRIDRAKALLAETDDGIARIAERLGYCDVYFFSRQFKQIAKQTPGAFRRQFNARRRAD